MIVDLSIPISTETLTYHNDPQLELEDVATMEKDGYRMQRLTINTHHATHIDAPSHMLQDGKTLDQYPLEKFFGTAIVIDVRGQKLIDENLQEVKKRDFVFFYTGQSKIKGKPYFENSPELTESITRKLIGKGVNMVGLDSYSPDWEPFTIHKLLLENDILIVENLVNLEKLVGRRFECVVLPLPIEKSDGAPCRVVARLE